jgi:hypothetical protein
MRKVFLLTTWALALASPAPGWGETADGEWPSLTRRMEEAALSGDEATLRSVKKQLAGLKNESLPKERAVLVHYALAYVGWRLSVLPGVSSDEGEELLDTAHVDIDDALALDDRFAEAYVLRSSLYGPQIGSSMWRGMTLGPKSGAAIDRALELEPNNPRAAMGKGIGAFHTPSMF